MSRSLIFISYRRSGDASGYAGRVNEELRRHFGDASVFMDVSDIEAGRVFGVELTDALASCAVFLPVIGRQWLTLVDAGNQRRLDDPADWVRREVEIALSRNITIIPVLVEGAAMPDDQRLPAPLRGLAGRQALELSDSRWAYDVQRLIQAIEAAIGVPWWHRLLGLGARGRTRILVRVIRGLVVALAVGMGVLTWYESTFPAMVRTPPLYAVALVTGLLVSVAIDWVLARFGPSAP